MASLTHWHCPYEFRLQKRTVLHLDSTFHEWVCFLNPSTGKWYYEHLLTASIRPTIKLVRRWLLLLATDNCERLGVPRSPVGNKMKYRPPDKLNTRTRLGRKRRAAVMFPQYIPPMDAQCKQPRKRITHHSAEEPTSVGVCRDTRVQKHPLSTVNRMHQVSCAQQWEKIFPSLEMAFDGEMGRCWWWRLPRK